MLTIAEPIQVPVWKQSTTQGVNFLFMIQGWRLSGDTNQVMFTATQVQNLFTCYDDLVTVTRSF